MSKYIVKKCPALSYGRTKFKKCYRVGWKQDCKDYENCPIKQIVELCKDIKGKDPIVAERIKYKQALENIKQFLIFADHSNTSNKYFENVEKALNIANEVLK